MDQDWLNWLLCWTGTFSIMVYPTGINEINKSKVLIYPNPTSGLLTIEMENTVGGATGIEIYDITGKAITRKKCNTGKTHFTEQIDVSGYNEGIYLVKIVQAKGVFVKRVLIN